MNVEEIKFGWRKDLPDHRDLDINHNEIKPFLVEKELPESHIIPVLPAIKDQKSLGSCTANAGTYMHETFAMVAALEEKNGSMFPDPLSRLFLYKVTRKLMGLEGDTGAYLRDTMKAMVLFGVPPEIFWPYKIQDLDKEPTAFEYSIAQNFQSLKYYKLDPFKKDPEKIIESIKFNIASNRACMFGFVVYSNMDNNTGEIPMPDSNSSRRGGHAMSAVGYDDKKKVGKSIGAFRDANSWGTNAGEDGFYWLPYDYVREGLASDFWTLFSAEWVKLSVFK